MLAGLAHPWILAAVIPGQAQRFGVEVGSVQVNGYKSLILEDVRYEQETIEGVIGSLELMNPVVWGLGGLARRLPEDKQFQVEDWSVVFLENPESSLESGPEKPVAEILDEIRWMSGISSALDIAETIERWVRSGSAGPGMISTGSRELKISGLKYEEGALDMAGTLDTGGAVSLAVKREEKRMEYDLKLGEQLLVLSGHVGVSTSTASLFVEGILFSGDLSLTAELDDTGAWPQAFELVWKNPDPEWVRRRVEGLAPRANTFEIRQSGREWRLDWVGEGQWDREGLKSPIDWQITTRLSGDRETARLTDLEVALPFANLALDRPFAIAFWPFELNRKADFSGEIDLNHPIFSTLPLEGRANLVLNLDNSRQPGEAVRISGSAELMESQLWNQTRADFDGWVAAENWQLGRLNLERGESSLTMTGSGAYALEESLQGELKGKFRREDLAPWLPEAVPGFSAVTMRGNLKQGPDTPLQYLLNLESEGIELPNIGPGSTQFSLEGGREGGDWNLALQADPGSLDAAGTLILKEKDLIGIGLSTLAQETQNQAAILLQEPVFITIPRNLSDGLTLDILGPIRFGEEGKAPLLEIFPGFHLENGVPQFERIRISSLDLMRFQPWVKATIPEIKVQEILLAWGQADLVGATLSADLEYTDEAFGTLQLFGALAVERESVELEALTLKSSDGIQVDASGRLPLVLEMGAVQDFRYQLLQDQPIELEGGVSTGGRKIRFSREDSQVEAENLELSYSLGGTFKKPIGRITTQGSRLSLKSAGLDKPLELMDWNVRLWADPDQFELETGNLILWNTPLNLRGRVARDGERVSQMLAGDWTSILRAAELGIQIDGLNLSDWADLLPAALLPEGDLTTDIGFQYEKGFAGSIAFSGLSLLPSDKGDSVRDITGALQLEGYSARLESGRLQANGRPVTFNGNVTWDVRKPQPVTFSVDLKGKDIPLVRQSDLVLRSDINLKLARGSAMPVPKVTGAATLKDGLFLRNFLELFEAGTASADNKPPYFSISTPPLGDWELDVDLKGDSFMSLNSSVARGILSADIKLLGTLETPFLLGSVWLESGYAQLPFGRINMESAQAEFTASQPYNPILTGSGKSNTMGYQIDLGIGGTLSNPEIDFKSDPALADEEVILLLTAGVVPQEDGANPQALNTSKLAMYLGRGYIGDIFGSSGPGKLRIRSGEEITQAGRETFQIEYDLSNTWSVLGEYDKYDDYNLDLRWRLGGK